MVHHGIILCTGGYFVSPAGGGLATGGDALTKMGEWPIALATGTFLVAVAITLVAGPLAHLAEAMVSAAYSLSTGGDLSAKAGASPLTLAGSTETQNGPVSRTAISVEAEA